MTKDDLTDLRTGDLIRHKGSGESLVVVLERADRVIATRTYEVTNPGEWDRVDHGGRVISSECVATGRLPQSQDVEVRAGRVVAYFPGAESPAYLSSADAANWSRVLDFAARTADGLAGLARDPAQPPFLRRTEGDQPA